MRYTLAAVMTLAASVAMVATFSGRIDASTGPIPLNCNRACLENLVDQYLAAVVAHDPKKMPFSADVKYTENYQVLQIEDGFWKTAQARGKYTHIFSAPEGGQVASMGTMIEADQPLLMSLRLRIELGPCKAFLIEGGKIRRVEMVGPSVPFHINSPWGGLSGN